MMGILRPLGLACIGLAMLTGSQSDAASNTFIGTATIIAPLAIAKTGGGDDLQFGSVAASATNPGTVTVDTADGRLAGGNAQLAGGTATSLDITLTGTATLTYLFAAIPNGVLSDGGGNTMIVNTFTNDCTGTIPGGGTEDCQVGGTLQVAAAQVAGAYSTANAGGTPISITVDYN